MVVEKRVSPLRYAPVEMTTEKFALNISGRI
jgi:hypothetical protein